MSLGFASELSRLTQETVVFSTPKSPTPAVQILDPLSDISNVIIAHLPVDSARLGRNRLCYTASRRKNFTALPANIARFYSPALRQTALRPTPATSANASRYAGSPSTT